jgi:hypothetical protein
MINKTKMTNKNWMKNNWDIIKEKSIKDIYLVGTHDSTCYKLNYSPCTDVFKGLPSLYQFIGSLFPCIVNKFTQTQNLTIYEQLCLGVRFLDFRICFYNGVYYCSHTYMCGPLEDFLKQINKFTNENPDEIIILRYSSDYNHRNTIQDSNEFTKLHVFIVSCIGPLTNTMTRTYNDAINKDIISYLTTNKLNDIASHGPVIVFNTFDTVWFNVNSFDLFKKSYIDYNNPLYCYGLDCVITPNEKTNFLSGSLESYAKQVKDYLITQKEIDKSIGKFSVYNFDYIDEEIVNYIISYNLL